MIMYNRCPTCEQSHIGSTREDVIGQTVQGFILGLSNKTKSSSTRTAVSEVVRVCVEARRWLNYDLGVYHVHARTLLTVASRGSLFYFCISPCARVRNPDGRFARATQQHSV